MKKLLSLVAAMLLTVVAMANTVYFVNQSGWTNLHCYAWTGGTNNGGWPGVAMTKESYQLGGYDVYSYTTTESYENCIFNAGGQPQTANLTWTEGQYYNGTAWKTRAELEGQGGGTQGGGTQGGGTQGGGTQGGGVTGDGNPRYYWKGYVDGGDVEPDASTLFEDGISSITVATDGYIFVVFQIDGQQGQQYMASAYDAAATHVTLTINGGGKYEKLHVPAGEHTLYLYDNGDGSLELSLVELPGKILAGTTGTGLEEIRESAKATKFLRDGKLYLQTGSGLYEISGRRL